MMDNFFIFFIHSGDSGHYCGYVKMVALYSMALVTFLPTCFFAYQFQAKMYDNGNFKWRVMFVVTMVVITIIFFEFRLFLVYACGWANLMKKLLTPYEHKVV